MVDARSLDERAARFCAFRHITDNFRGGTACEFAPGRVLAMDRLDPTPGQMTHDSIDGEVTDSAASATAMATGIVSSVFLIDATPGVWAAHTANRYNYSDIARQQALGLGDHSWGGRLDGVEVLLGAGAAYYKPQGANGTGDLNLIDELMNRGYEYVRKAAELNRALAPENRLLGFFGGTAMTYVLDRPLKKGFTEPTLAEMTAKALEIVGRGADGETLLVITADHETGGLELGPNPDLEFIGGVSATVDRIWGAIEGGMTIDSGMKTYAGIGGAWPALSAQEREAIRCSRPDRGRSSSTATLATAVSTTPTSGRCCSSR